MPCEHCDDAGRCTHICEIEWPKAVGDTEKPAEAPIHDARSYPPHQLIQHSYEPLRESVRVSLWEGYYPNIRIVDDVPFYWSTLRNVNLTGRNLNSVDKVMEVGKEYIYVCNAKGSNREIRQYELKVKVLWIGRLSVEEEVAVCLRETLKKKWCLDKFDPFTGNSFSLRPGQLVSVDLVVVKDLDWI